MGGVHDENGDGVGARGFQGGPRRLVDDVLHVEIDGEKHLVAIDGVGVRSHRSGGEVVVEGVFDAVEGDIVGPHVADDVRGEPALGVEAAEIVFHADAGELARRSQLLDLGSLRGSHPALDDRVPVVVADDVENVPLVHAEGLGEESNT